MLKKLVTWWKSHIRIVGKETYVRLFPNPGFRIVFKRGTEMRWSQHDGWRYGRIR